MQLCWTQSKQDGTFEFQNVPSNGKWKIGGENWTDTPKIAPYYGSAKDEPGGDDRPDDTQSAMREEEQQ